MEDCVFVGGSAAVSFVNIGGAIFRHNTIVRPRNWVLRILQETREPGFVPSRNGVFERNLIVFRSDLRDMVNVGPATAAETFRFMENWWCCEDRPERSQPRLPAPGGSWCLWARSPAGGNSRRAVAGEESSGGRLRCTGALGRTHFARRSKVVM